MGVSFKVAKVGTRYRPKVGLIEDGDHGNQALEGNITAREIDHGHADNLANPELPSVYEDFEVSFSLNLLPDGYYVGKASEVFNDVSTKLLPYNWESETLFTAIEYGWLPGDVFDDIPCKYVDGAVLCEIRDYRNCPPRRSCTVNPPVHKVLLHMCMENVVKDIQSLSDDSWSYKDLLEVESRILKVLQPELNLNPKPLLEKYPGKPPKKKINLGLSQACKRRKRNDEQEPARATTDSSQNQTSNCQSGLVHYGKAAPSPQQEPLSQACKRKKRNDEQEPARATTDSSQNQTSNCQSGLVHCGKAAPSPQQAVPVSAQTLQENVIVHSPARNSNCQSGLVDCGKAALCSQQAVPKTLQENVIEHLQPAQNSNCQSGLVDCGKAALCSQQAVPKTLQENVIEHLQPAQNSNCQSGPVYRDKAAPCAQQPVSVSVQSLQENAIVHSQPAQNSNGQSGPVYRGKAAPCSQQAVPVSVQTLQENVFVCTQTAQNSSCQPSPVHRGKAAQCSQQAVPTSVQSLQENAIVHSQPDPLKSYVLSNSRGKSVGTVQTSSAIVPPQNQHLNSSSNDVREEGSLVPVDRGRLAEATQRPVMKQPKLEIVDFFQDQYPARQHRSKNTLCQGSPGGIPTLQNGTPASIVNERPNMTNPCHRVGAPTINNPHFAMSVGNNQYNLPSSPQVTANTSSTSSHGTQIRHPAVRSVSGEVVDRKSKALQKEASAKQRKRGFGVSILESLAGTASLSAPNASTISEGSANLPPNSEAHSSPFHRFLKIEEVTQRYHLNERKRKLDQILPQKSFSRINPLVGKMLEEDNDNEKQKYPVMERTTLSNCFVDKRLIASKTRILIYVLLAHIFNGFESIKIDTKYKVRMMVTEKFNEQMVEARWICGEEESHHLLTFPNPHSADLFASQFTSLMAREGYRLAADSVVPIPVNSVGIQQPEFIFSNGKQISGVPLGLTFPYGPSPATPNALAGEPLQTGRHLPFPANLQPALQLSGNNLSKLAFDVSAQFSHSQPHLRPGHPLYQLLQREREHQLLLQRKIMMERLGAGMGGPGSIRLDGGSQGINSGHGLLRLPGVGQIPGIDNFTQSQNLGGFIANNFHANSMSPRTAVGRGKALMTGVSVQREASVVPTPPTYLDMAYVLNNQPPPQPFQHHQKVLRRQPVRLPLQAQASITETATASFLRQTLQQPQLNQGSSSQPINGGNMINFSQTQSQLSSQTHEPANSGNSSSFSRDFADFIKDSETGREDQV